MKAYLWIGTLFVALCLCSIQNCRAQEQETAETITQEAAFLKLQELGFAQHNSITGEDFIDQIKAGNLEAVKLYLAAGMSPDERDMFDVDHHRNALLWAAELGHAEVVRALVEAGANVGVKDKVGRTALVVAAHFEQDAVVEVLLHRQ